MAEKFEGDLVVLQSTNAPDGSTRYIDQVVSRASDATRFRYFTWRVALFGRYDAFHLHWPESLVASPHGGVRTLKSLLVFVLLLRWKVTRTPLVRTVHNIDPREPQSALERAAMRALDYRTTLFVLINRQDLNERFHPSVTILHGHYRARFDGMKRGKRVPGRILYFGMIKAYKNVGGLITAFLSTPNGTLRILGKADAKTRQDLLALAGRNERISFRFGFVGDEELVREVTAADIVVLPYRELYNSGVALVALSLGVPILVPASPAADELADEVGPSWVYTFDGHLDTSQLHLAAERAADHGASEPNLIERDWETVAHRYEQAYRQARALTR